MKTIHAVNKSLTVAAGIILKKAVNTKKAKLAAFNDLLIKYKKSKTDKTETKNQKLDTNDPMVGKVDKAAKRKNFHDSSFAINTVFIKVNTDKKSKPNKKIVKQIETVEKTTIGKVSYAKVESKSNNKIVADSGIKRKQTADKLSVKTEAAPSKDLHILQKSIGSANSEPSNKTSSKSESAKVVYKDIKHTVVSSETTIGKVSYAKVESKSNNKIVADSGIKRKQTADKLSVKTEAAPSKDLHILQKSIGSADSESANKISLKVENSKVVYKNIESKAVSSKTTEDRVKPHPAKQLNSEDSINVKTKLNAFKSSYYADSLKYANYQKMKQTEPHSINHTNRSIIAKYEELSLRKNRIIHTAKTNKNDGKAAKHSVKAENIKNRVDSNFKNIVLEADTKKDITKTKSYQTLHAAISQKTIPKTAKFDAAINILNNLSNVSSLSSAQGTTLTSAETGIFNSSISGQINSSVSNAASFLPKTPTLSINLYPPKLGRVFLKLSITSSGMILRLSAINSTTVQLLQNKIDDLKDSLSRNNIVVSKILVEIIPQVSSAANQTIQNSLNSNNNNLNWSSNNNRNFSGNNHGGNRETFSRENKDGENKFYRQQFNAGSLNLWI